VPYRFTVTSGPNTASDTSNVADIVEQAVNLVQNSGFENGMTNWALFGSNGTYRAATAAARTGSYGLELDYGSAEWQGVYQAAIALKPNTNYTLTYWYKYAADDTAKNCYCFVRGGAGTIDDALLASAYMHTGSQTEWKQETLSFCTDDSGKLCIDFRVVAGTHTYIDDVELYEVQ